MYAPLRRHVVPPWNMGATTASVTHGRETRRREETFAYHHVAHNDDDNNLNDDDDASAGTTSTAEPSTPSSVSSMLTSSSSCSEDVASPPPSKQQAKVPKKHVNVSPPAQSKKATRTTTATLVPVYIAVLVGLYGVVGDDITRAGPTASDLVNSPLLKPTRDQLAFVVFFMTVGAATLALVRSTLKRHVLDDVAANWAGLSKGNAKARANGIDTNTHAKFMEQAFSGTYYILETLIMLACLRDWAWCPGSQAGTLALSVPGHVRVHEQANDVRLRLVYGMALSFYSLETCTLVASIANARWGFSHHPTLRKRKDASVMLVHHVATLTLLSFSWMSLHHRVGTLVLLYHDCADPALCLGKAYVYAQPHIRRSRSKETYNLHKTIATTSFAVFVVLFMVGRLGVFGGLIHTLSVQHKWFTQCYLEAPQYTPYECGSAATPFADALLFSMLLVLYAVDVFWALVLVQMTGRVVCASDEVDGQYGDVRSDDDDE